MICNLCMIRTSLHEFSRIIFLIHPSMYSMYSVAPFFSFDQDVPQTSAATSASPQTQTRIHSLSLTDPIGDEDDE